MEILQYFNILPNDLDLTNIIFQSEAFLETARLAAKS